MKTLKTYFIVILVGALSVMFFTAPPAYAGGSVVLVVGSGSTLQSISTTNLRRVWLGQAQEVGGVKLKAAEAEGAGAVQDEFYAKHLGKTVKEVKKYFIKEALGGGAKPPKTFPDSDALVKALASDPSLVSFLDQTAFDKLEAGKLKIVKVSE